MPPKKLPISGTGAVAMLVREVESRSLTSHSAGPRPAAVKSKAPSESQQPKLDAFVGKKSTTSSTGEQLAGSGVVLAAPALCPPTTAAPRSRRKSSICQGSQPAQVSIAASRSINNVPISLSSGLAESLAPETGTFLFTDGDVPNFDDAEEEELLVEELNDVGDEENFKSFQQIAEQSTFAPQASRNAKARNVFTSWCSDNTLDPKVLNLKQTVRFLMESADISFEGTTTHEKVEKFRKLRCGVNNYFCGHGLQSPLDHPILTKFYKGLRKRANLQKPRPRHRSSQITESDMTVISCATITSGLNKNVLHSCVHRFIQHACETIGAASGRRIEDLTEIRFVDVGYYKEPRLPIGKTPIMLIRDAKNNTDQAREPFVLPILPFFGNRITCPSVALAMMFEATEMLYHSLSPTEHGDCYIFPPLNQSKTIINIRGQPISVTINRALRDSLVAATGQPYVVHIGPFTKNDGNLVNTSNTTSKGYRRGLHQRCVLRNISTLGAHAVGDWDGKSANFYVEFESDVVYELFMQLHDIPGFLAMLVDPYCGALPENLAYAAQPRTFKEENNQWATAHLRSALGSYNRGDILDWNAISNRMAQFYVLFETVPKPFPGKFSVSPWGVTLLPISVDPRQTAPSRDVMQVSTGLVRTLFEPLQHQGPIYKEIALAAGSAMAVACCAPPVSAESAALTAISRFAALQHNMAPARIQSACQAAFTAAAHYPPQNWPLVFLRVAGAVLNADLSDSNALGSLESLLSHMSMSAHSDIAHPSVPECVLGAHVAPGIMPAAVQPGSLLSPPQQRSVLVSGVGIAAAPGISPAAVQPGSHLSPPATAWQPSLPGSLLHTTQSQAPGHVRRRITEIDDSDHTCALKNITFKTMPNKVLRAAGTGTLFFKSKFKSVGGFYDAQQQAWFFKEAIQAQVTDILRSPSDSLLAISSQASFHDSLPVASVPAPVSITHIHIPHPWRIQIAPAPVQDARGLPLLDMPLKLSEMEGVFPRWCLWEGLIVGWPALRLVDNVVVGAKSPWSVAANNSTVSKIRTASSAINTAVGICKRPLSDTEIQTVHTYCMNLNADHTTSTFTGFYKSVSKQCSASGVASVATAGNGSAPPVAQAASGVKRLRADAAEMSASVDDRV